jgi:nitrite reductase/ring-hydroxylating ferredoxin subunit
MAFDPVAPLETSTSLDMVSKPLAEQIQKVTRPAAIENAMAGTWLGHKLHPVLTDIPMGAWMMAAVLDYSMGEAAAPAARRLVGTGILAAVPTAATGANDWSTTYGAQQRVGLVHALGNSVGTTLQAASWIARRGGRRKTGVALSTIGLGFTAGAAYLGGHLTLTNGVGVAHTAFEEAVSEWTDVAANAAVIEGKPLRVKAKDVPVVLVRQHGNIFALSATCAHAGGPLDEGKIVDDALACPWHNSIFALADGRVVRGPASEGQPSWDVKVDGDRVLVRSAGS